LEIIESECTNPELSRDSAAAKLNVSPDLLDKTLEKWAGTSFNANLRACRIKKAKSILRENREPVSETGKLCGFHRNEDFVQAFGAITKTSPEGYRANCISGEEEDTDYDSRKTRS
jgi:transcriptional regulator GlxA family with amidase domain